MGMHQLLGPISGDSSDLQIDRSLRFNQGDSPSLSKTFSSNGNRRKWTWSCWFKLGALNQPGRFLGAGSSASERTNIFYHSSQGSSGIAFYSQVGGYTEAQGNTNSVFRDPSAWYHLVFQFDCANSTGTDRVKIYINGVEQTITFQAQPTNIDHFIGGNVSHVVGRGTDGYSFDGYLAECHYVNGQLLSPSNFGELNDDNVWIPKKFSGSYGTNGFYLKFADNSSASALGTDSSGGSNTFTVNNLSVAAGSGNDSLFDSPTNGSQSNTGAGGQVSGNYATWSPLVAQSSGSITLSNGNLDTTCGTTRTTAMSSFPLLGKTYWEITFGSGTYNYIGMTEATGFNTVANNNSGIKYTGYQSYSYGWQQTDGKLYKASNIIASPGTYSNGDVLGWAYDADNNTLKLYKNGSLVHTENNIADAQYFPAITHSGTATASTNFGQRAFAYTAPSGYKPVSTATSIPTPTIADGSDYIDVKLYTGNGTSYGNSQTISGLSFSPDFLWIKCRSHVSDFHLANTVNGINKNLESNNTGANQTNNNNGYISATTSDGFTVVYGGIDGLQTNDNSKTYAAWAWNAASSTASNTDGSITSSVRANPTAGFSIVAWTSSSSVSTVGHGLNAAPYFIITKNRSTTNAWWSYHYSLGNTKAVRLDTNDTPSTMSSTWNNTSPTNSVFTVGGEFGNGNSMIAYCFAPVEGYSAFGTYTGNGSSDGTFISTRMRPRWIIIKSSDATGSWVVHDTKRATYNASTSVFYANETQAEYTNSGMAVDILSNGFKIRTGNSSYQNSSGVNYIYAAFAEHPFKTARAR